MIDAMPSAGLMLWRLGWPLGQSCTCADPERWNVIVWQRV